MDDVTGKVLKFPSRLIVHTEVDRREEGIAITFHFEDEGVDRYYFSPDEARDVLRQLDEAIEKAILPCVVCNGSGRISGPAGINAYPCPSCSASCASGNSE